MLEDRFAAIQVWVWDDKHPDIAPHQEWLAMRIESNGDRTYTYSNAPEDSLLQFLAKLLCGRYFVERVIEDSKDEVGADEFQAQKYLAWEHHTALTACAGYQFLHTNLFCASSVSLTLRTFNSGLIKLDYTIASG